MKRQLPLLAAVTLLSCKAADNTTAPDASPEGAGAGVAAIVATGETLDTLFGPMRFERTTGAPIQVERTISTDGFESPFVLRVRNGDADGGSRVSSATVTLDGALLLGPSDFSPQRSEYAVPVPLAATGTLVVGVAGKPGSYLEITVEGKRSGLLVCPGIEGAYATLDAALADAPDGATIRFCDGTHSVGDAHLGDRAVTLAAVHPRAATLDAGGASHNIGIGSDGPQAAAIEIRDLVFVNAASTNVFIAGNHGPVRIVNSEFRPAEGAPYGGELSYNAGVGVFSSSAPVTVDRSRFIGGDIGVQEGGANVSILNSEFVAQTNAAIHGDGAGAVLHAEGNTISGCGRNWCIGVFATGTTMLRGNTINISADRPVTNVIQVANGTYRIVDNVISGEYDSRKKRPDFAILDFAISIGGNGAGTVSGNRISGARNAFDLQHGPGRVEDNVVTGAETVIAFSNGASWQVHRNDFTEYERPFLFVFDAPDASATCNWWGSALGPTKSGVPPELYAPWATEPIAGTANLCDESGGLPMAVRVCATATAGSLTVPTIARAIDIVASGGTVSLCDGTHAGSPKRIEKPLTVRAEGPGVPAIVNSGPPALVINSVVGGDVIVRDVSFDVNGGSGIVIDGGTDHVVVSHVYFRMHPTSLDPSGGTGIYTGSNDPTRRRGVLEVMDSQFENGFRGIDVGTAVDRVIVTRSAFTHPQALGFTLGVSPGAVLVATGNTFVGCGEQCVGGGSMSQVEFNDNDVTVNADAPVPFAVAADGNGMVLQMNRNVIRGLGQIESPDPASRYPIRAGILVVNGARLTGSDNVVSGVGTGVEAYSGSATLTRSDFTDYARAFDATATSNLRCNWWGNAAGPQEVFNAPASVYTPFATEPVAGHPEVSCSS